MRRNIAITWRAALGLSVCLGAAACGDDEGTVRGNDGGAPGSQTEDSGAPPTANVGVDSGLGQSNDAGPTSTGDASTDAGAVDPVYAIVLGLPDPTGTNLTYVSVQRDLNFGAIKREGLRQFTAYSGLAAIGGHYFHGDGTSPILTKYRITDQLVWESVATINFGAFPLPEGETLNFYYGNFKDENTVYLHYGEDKAFRVQWDPAQAKIIKGHTDTALPAPTAELQVGASGNRTGLKWFKGPVMQPYHQTVLATDDYGPTSYITVYDEQTHAEKTVHVIENCPGLEIATKDEQGNVYFATYHGAPVAALYNKGPAPCVVRAKADGTLDPTWTKTDLRDYTGGQYVVNFRYLKDGKATAHAFQPEKAGLSIDTTAYSPDIIWGSLGVPEAWEYIMIDLNARTSKVITGFKPEHDLAASGQTFTVDGRTFLSVTNDDGTSAIYEINTDGTVRFDADVIGQIDAIERLR